MKILIIKLSSLGDLIHALPAVRTITDHHEVFWLVDQGFSSLFPSNSNIKAVKLPLRKLKANKTSLSTWYNCAQVIRELRKEKFDLIIDLQGLIKSAILCKLIGAKHIHGIGKNSIKERVAGFAYHQTTEVGTAKHIINKNNLLVSDAVKVKSAFTIPQTVKSIESYKNIILIINTTGKNRHWPKEHWRSLINMLLQHDPEITFTIPYLDQQQFAEQKELYEQSGNVKPIREPDLNKFKEKLKGFDLAISVDTGIGHLCYEAELPTIGLYGPTSSERNGIFHANNLKSPTGIMKDLSPEQVFNAITL